MQQVPGYGLHTTRQIRGQTLVIIMAQKRLRHLYLLIFLLWCYASLFLGCSATPRIYTMPPRELENIRAGVGNVGVVLVEAPAESEVLMPAKGFWGGAQRGFIVGARLPVLIGFISPVPGGTLLGIFAAPFTATFGGMYGALTAPPAREVEAAEKTLKEASAEMRQMGLRENFIETVTRLGNDRTGHRFLKILDIATGEPNKEILYNPSDLPGVDTVLELKIVKTGLRGRYGIDPYVNTFVQTRIRLIRLKDNAELLDESIYCQSDQERTFQEWSQNAGIFLIEEFRSCVSELAEKTIDDFFLIYPAYAP
jgi:hypothetical protein